MKYTVIPGVVLTEICDEHFLVATGSARGRVPYVKGLNETGAYFFSKIKFGMPTESIINDAAERYETTTQIIAPSFGSFLQALVNSGYLQEIPESTPPAKPGIG